MSNPNSTLYGGEAEAVAEARKYTQANGLPDPYRAYSQHKNSAKIREIEWGFTFSSWWAIWQPYFHMRGSKTKNHLCMAREMDVGPYAPGNVYLTTIMGNIEDYHKRSAHGISARQESKEKRERAFARAGSSTIGSRNDTASHLTYKAHNTSKATCNYRDELSQWELSLL